LLPFQLKSVLRRSILAIDLFGQQKYGFFS
jgi:hypothetical protein